MQYGILWNFPVAHDIVRYCGATIYINMKKITGCGRAAAARRRNSYRRAVQRRGGKGVLLVNDNGFAERNTYGRGESRKDTS